MAADESVLNDDGKIGMIFYKCFSNSCNKQSGIITLALAFMFQREDFTAKSLLGCALSGAGTLLVVL